MTKEAGFAELYTAHYRQVRGLCRQLLGSADRAEDAAQEAFARAYRAFASYDAAQPFAAWIMSIARNYCSICCAAAARKSRCSAARPRKRRRPRRPASTGSAPRCLRSAPRRQCGRREAARALPRPARARLLLGCRLRRYRQDAGNHAQPRRRAALPRQATVAPIADGDPHDLPFPDHPLDVRRRRAVGARGRERSSSMRRLAPRAARAWSRSAARAQCCAPLCEFADDPAPIPRFAPPPRARDFVVLVASVLLIGGFSKAFWSTRRGGHPERAQVVEPIRIGRALRARRRCHDIHRLRGNCYVDCCVELRWRGARDRVRRLARVLGRAPPRVRGRSGSAARRRRRAAVDRSCVRDPAKRGCRDRCGRRDDQRHAARDGPDRDGRRHHQRRPARVRPRGHGARQRHG